MTSVKPGSSSHDCRVGYTVSKRVGNAVERNRARRRLRAAAAAVLPAHARPGHDFVVIGVPATLTRAFADLAGDLRTALKHVGAWRETDAVAP